MDMLQLCLYTGFPRAAALCRHCMLPAQGGTILGCARGRLQRVWGVWIRTAGLWDWTPFSTSLVPSSTGGTELCVLKEGTSRGDDSGNLLKKLWAGTPAALLHACLSVEEAQRERRNFSSHSQPVLLDLLMGLK